MFFHLWSPTDTELNLRYAFFEWFGRLFRNIYPCTYRIYTIGIYNLLDVRKQFTRLVECTLYLNIEIICYLLRLRQFFLVSTDLTMEPKQLTLEQRLQALNIRYWTLVCLLASCDVLGPLATDAHLPSLQQMTSDLHTSDAWIQLSVLGYSLVLAISSLIGGYLSDKYGRRPITIIGLIFFILGGYGCAFAPSIWVLNISRFVQGFGGGISSIITSSVARDVFLADERMKILGVLGSLRPFAIAMAPVFGGWIAETSKKYSWRMVFGVTSSIAVVVIIAAIILLPETRERFFTKRILSESQQSLNPNERQNIFKIVFSDCILITLSWMIAFRMVAVFVFLSEFPYVASNNYGYSELISGIVALFGVSCKCCFQ